MDQIEVHQILEGKGIHPSYQRSEIYRFLWYNRIHPTADEIYERLHPEIPTLSRTTVYNTIKLFVQKGVLTALTLEDKELRYDINTSLHAHFKCDRCGLVYDFPVRIPDLPVELAEYDIQKRELTFWGICRNCRNLEKT